MTNKQASALYKAGFSASLSYLSQREYWETIFGTQPGGAELAGVYNSQADMYAEIGNPPLDIYRNKFYAYKRPDGIFWNIVKVV